MAKFREIQRFLGENIEEWFGYHWNNFSSDFNIGMRNLKLEDNFRSKRVSAIINDSGEVQVRHDLGVIPTGYLILNGVGGVLRGNSDWTAQYAYLRLDTDLYTAKAREADILFLG